MKTWNEMTEAEQLNEAMKALNYVMGAEKRAANKRRKMQEAAKDFCNINTIDKFGTERIVTYNI